LKLTSVQTLLQLDYKSNTLKARPSHLTTLGSTFADFEGYSEWKPANIYFY